MFDQALPLPAPEVLEEPKWLEQRRLIGSGKATWDDFTIIERTCKGWLLPYLWGMDSQVSGRWGYWTRSIVNGEPLDEPIPHIDFLDSPNSETMKNLTKCLSAYNRYDFRLSDFLEWLLWGFGAQDERARISDEANDFLYKTFCLDLLLMHPHDYLGHILTEEKAGYWNNPSAFYPTPHAVCNAMVKMTFADAIREGQDLKSKSVHDPCVGTGRMLMYASNYSLFLYGQDIDRTCCNACAVNGYLYMPWLVRAGLPRPIDNDPEKEKPIIKACNSLEVAAPTIELKPASDKNQRSKKPQQLNLF